MQTVFERDRRRIYEPCRTRSLLLGGSSLAALWRLVVRMVRSICEQREIIVCKCEEDNVV